MLRASLTLLSNRRDNIVLKFFIGSKKLNAALTLSILGLLVISGISGLNIAYGGASNAKANQQIAGSQNLSHNYQALTSSTQSGTSAVGCVEPLTSGKIDAYYSEPYCYGHDESTLGFVSNQPGSGGNAVLNFTLPSSTSSLPQGDFYITFWFGGVVCDPSSLDNQAFMEFQFYPTSPQYTGPGSGPKDCNSQGFFYSNSSGLNSNLWFACVFVFALNTTSYKEYVPYSAALDSPSRSNSTMILNGNDLISLKLSGRAQSTQPWQISLSDYTSAQQSAVLSLQNGSSIFSPYYDVSSPYTGVLWGADQTPAINFAFEIGHSLTNDCSGKNFTNGGTGGIPGDGTCDSYWPGLWTQTVLIHIYSPLMGTSPSFPSAISFSSSQGGVSEVYNSSQPLSGCQVPSFATSTNCIYPFYVYEYNTSSFVFVSSIVSGGAIDYGNAYQFPGTRNTTNGQFMENVQPSPTSIVTFTHTTTSVSTVTSISTSITTSTSSITVTRAPVQQAFTLIVETRSSGGSGLAGQTVTLSNSTGFSSQGTTNSAGDLIFNGLSPGSSYTATSNIDGVTLSATVTFNGNSMILLEPTNSQTIPSYVLFIIVALAVVAVASVLVIRRRQRTRFPSS